MTSKEFKRLIKEHKVKQFLSYIKNGQIIRVYTTTSLSDEHKSYQCNWYLNEDKKLIRNVREISKDTLRELCENYVDDCNKLRNVHKDETIELINKYRVMHTGIPEQEITMDERKYYKQAATTLTFQLGDERVLMLR